MSDIINALNSPKCLLGESPKWYQSVNSDGELVEYLIYIDILSYLIHVHNPLTNDSSTMKFDQSVGFVLPSNKSLGEKLILIVGLEDRVVEVDFFPQTIISTILVVPETYYENYKRFNDAECNPDGLIFAGFMHPQWRDGFKGNYFLISACGSFSQDGNTIGNLHELELEGGIGLPNGTAWISSDTFYLVDSKLNQIRRVKIDEESLKTSELVKVLENSTVFELSEEFKSTGSILDGMAIDADLKLWVAVSGAGRVLRIDPELGEILHTLHTPTKKPVSCTFGKFSL
jgi:sugar lactone lactonase YvrE